MPPRKNRNANRFSAGNTPNLQPAKLLPELDTPSPASLAEDLPYIYGDPEGGSELTREPTPEPQMDILGHQVDLLDMQEGSERVRGDIDYGMAYAASSPPARAFDLSDSVDVHRETSAEAYEPGHVRSPVLVR
ncbi:hypothetical protein FIBSPDRAFT_357316 [Athelia psychrophila]|uniref:Uncharacterized protein n=1 Tax=Athelia psychrophila TaxID=1759441 RepID=A0A166PIH4_9AGAM|nr:hypothetical protein FIBSPDRAFT_357316 [Fibularhizoctonia sp. CBS 109695]